MSSVKSDASKQCPSCTGKYSSSFEFNHLQIDPVSHDKTLRHNEDSITTKVEPIFGDLHGQDAEPL